MYKLTRNSTVHFLHGVLAGFLSLTFFALSAFLFIQFFAYEYVEQSKIRDEMYFELREWSIGFILGLGIAWILRI